MMYNSISDKLKLDIIIQFLNECYYIIRSKLIHIDLSLQNIMINKYSKQIFIKYDNLLINLSNSSIPKIDSNILYSCYLNEFNKQEKRNKNKHLLILAYYFTIGIISISILIGNFKYLNKINIKKNMKITLTDFTEEIHTDFINSIDINPNKIAINNTINQIFILLKKFCLSNIEVCSSHVAYNISEEENNNFTNIPIFDQYIKLLDILISEIKTLIKK